MSNKVKTTKVEILWAEGLIEYADKFPMTFDNCTEASRFLMAQDHFPAEGYDKHKFIVTFEDGETYEGRLDCQSELRDCNIAEHIRGFCHYYGKENKEYAEFANKYTFN